MSAGRWTMRGYVSQGYRAAGRALANGGGTPRLWPITQPMSFSVFTGMRYGSFDKTAIGVNPDFMHGMLETFPYLCGEIVTAGFLQGNVSIVATLRGTVEVNP